MQAVLEPPVAAAESAGPSPLAESDYLVIRRALVAHRPIRNAARVARSSALVTLVIACAGLLGLVVAPSLLGLGVVAAVGAVGVVEYAGYLRLRRAMPAGAALLGKNQLALLGVIALYAVVQMATFSPDAAKEAALSPEVRAQLAGMPSMAAAIDRDIERLAPLLVYGFYSLVILASVGFQGGLALYYFTRVRRVAAFHRTTPPWVRRLFVEIGLRG
jgi:hypothetical protein